MKIKFFFDNNHFNLNNTLECGQCFRWQKKDDYFLGTVCGRFVKVEQKDLKEKSYLSALEVDILESKVKKLNKETEIRFWKNYFDLDRDYSYIKSKIKNFHPYLAKAIKIYGGIRILKQNPWEVLISFIISQNNNIPRIKSIIKNFCETFGEKIGCHSFDFPEPNTIVSLAKEDLDSIKLGFRSRYILDAAKKIEDKTIDLTSLFELNAQESEAILKKIKGVGPKVAACTLLYGFNKLDCAPVDVWIKRCLKTSFNNNNIFKELEFGGIAQQYLFIYTKNHTKNIN